jgi:hypothetical protein
MKRILFATLAATALLAGAGAASAQSYYNDGWGHDGPFVERGVGLQVGPLGAGIYDNGPAYYGGYSYQRGPVDNTTENMRAFRSQEVWPQSPPGGT